MYRLFTALFALTFLVASLISTQAVAQFVPPDDTDDYVPPPPPPPPDDDPSAGSDRPMSFSERQALKKKKAEAARKTSPSRRTDDDEGGAQQPVGFSIGVGAGFLWTSSGFNLGATDKTVGPGPGVVTSLINPNTFSVRLRLNESISIEPNVMLGFGSTRQITDQPGTDPENKFDGFAVTLGADVRFSVMTRGPASFIVLGGLGFGVGGIQDDPDGPDNLTRGTLTTFDVTWGLGVIYFITPHVAISADAKNPLVSFRQTKSEIPAADVTDIESRLNMGLVFNPSARMMFHIYY